MNNSGDNNLNKLNLDELIKLELERIEQEIDDNRKTKIEEEK